MTDCERYIEQISALIDGELEAEKAAKLHAHMDACPDCRRAFDAFKAVSEAMPEDLTAPPEDFAKGVMSKIYALNNAKKRRKTHVWGYLATAACLTLVVFGAWRMGFLSPAATSSETLENPGLADEQAPVEGAEYKLNLDIDVNTQITLPASNAGGVGAKSAGADNGTLDQFEELTRLLNGNFASNEAFVVSELERLQSAAEILVYEGAFVPDDEMYLNVVPEIKDFDGDARGKLFEMMQAATLLDCDEETARELEPFCTMVFTRVAIEGADEPQDVVVVVWIIDDALVFKIEGETPIVFVSDTFPIDFEEFLFGPVSGIVE